jgi:hypothetical protein
VNLDIASSSIKVEDRIPDPNNLGAWINLETFTKNTLAIPGGVGGAFSQDIRFQWDIHAFNNKTHPVKIQNVFFELFELDTPDEASSNDSLGLFSFGPPPRDVILPVGATASPPCANINTCSRVFTIPFSILNAAISGESEGDTLEFGIREVAVTGMKVPEPHPTWMGYATIAGGLLFQKRRQSAAKRESDS